MTEPTQAQIEAALKAYTNTPACDRWPQKAMSAALTAAFSLDPGEPRRLDDGNQGSPMKVGALTAAAGVEEFNIEIPTWQQVLDAPLTPHGRALVATTIERCAQVADDLAEKWDSESAGLGPVGYAQEIAAAIRSLKDDKNVE